MPGDWDVVSTTPSTGGQGQAAPAAGGGWNVVGTQDAPTQYPSGWDITKGIVTGAAQRGYEQTKGAWTAPPFGMSLDQGTPEEMRQAIEGPPQAAGELMSTAWNLIKSGNPMALTNLGPALAKHITMFPEWVQNLVAGKQVPESVGAGALDLYNSYLGLAGGRHYEPPLPASWQDLRPLAAQAMRAGGAAPTLRKLVLDKLADWVEKPATTPLQPSEFSDLIQARYGGNIPEGGAAPANLIRQVAQAQAQAGMNLTEAQIRGIAADLRNAAAAPGAAARAAATARRPAARPAEAQPAPSPGAPPEAPPAAPGEAPAPEAQGPAPEAQAPPARPQYRMEGGILRPVPEEEAAAPAAEEAPAEEPSEIRKTADQQARVEAEQRAADYERQRTLTEQLRRSLEETPVTPQQAIDQKAEEVSRAVDAVVPPDENGALNNRTQLEVDAHLRQGNVEAAQKALDDARAQLTPAPEEYAPFGGRFEAAGRPAPAAEPHPEVVRGIENAFAESADLQQLRADLEHQASGIRVGEEQERFAAERPGVSTKGMLTAAAGEEPPEEWTKMPNWSERDTTRVLNYHDAANQFVAANAPETAPPESAIGRAWAGKENTWVKQEQYDAARQAFKDEMGSSNFGVPITPKALQATAVKAAYHYERLLRTGQATFEAFSDAMLKEFGDKIQPYIETLWRQAKQPFGFKDQVSELVPSVEPKNRGFDPLATRMTPTRDALTKYLTAPQQASLADEWANSDLYPGLKLRKTDLGHPDRILGKAYDFILSNDDFLYNKVPANAASADGDLLNRESSAQWYQGYNRIADERARRYGMNDLQSSAGIAMLSPRTDWFQNVAGHQRILEGFFEDQNLPWTTGMSSMAKNVPIPGDVLSKIAGKKLEALTDDKEIAWWIRLHDLAEKPQRNVMAYAPNGDPLGYVTNKDGSNAKFIWAGNGMPPYFKLIDILKDGSRENISDVLGDGTKIRSFANNGHSYSYDGAGDYSQVSVTSDTHKVAGGLLLPVGGQAPQVTLNFAHSPGNGRVGVGGSYGLFADASREGAQNTGWLPNQHQSITWDGARILMPSEWRTKENLAIVKGIWQKVDSGKLTRAQAQQQIFDFAGGWDKPRPVYSQTPQD